MLIFVRTKPRTGQAVGASRPTCANTDRAASALETPFGVVVTAERARCNKPAAGVFELMLHLLDAKPYTFIQASKARGKLPLRTSRVQDRPGTPLHPSADPLNDFAIDLNQGRVVYWPSSRTGVDGDLRLQ